MRISQPVNAGLERIQKPQQREAELQRLEQQREAKKQQLKQLAFSKGDPEKIEKQKEKLKKELKKLERELQALKREERRPHVKNAEGRCQTWDKEALANGGDQVQRDYGGVSTVADHRNCNFNGRQSVASFDIKENVSRANSTEREKSLAEQWSKAQQERRIKELRRRNSESGGGTRPV